MSIVDPMLVGEVDTHARPFKRETDYGHVELSPLGAFEVRSLQTFKLIYTAGSYGVDDTGAIRIAFRFPMDSGSLQTHDPKGVNYVTAHTGNGVPLNVVYHPASHTRPRDRALTIHVSGGYLAEGDQITVVFGDRSEGSPGLQLQTFCESAFEFKVLVDVFATGHFVPLVPSPAIRIVPGKGSVWKAVVPTLRKCGDTFSLGIKAEDRWGNPSDQVAEELFIRTNRQIDNLPERIAFPLGQRAVRIENLTAHSPGIYRIQLFNARGDHLADANPLVVKTETRGGYWGDLHGQSGETVAINTAREYFTFARDLAFLDVTSHQGNDFQINNRFWKHLNALTAEFNRDGIFVAFPGYEWSGNTAVGGDHNVYFRHEGRPIRRSSHALLTDRSDIHTDANTLKELFTALADENCVVYAHVGGRYANPSYAHDAGIETAMEIHSDWGTFEWLLTDGFALGHRCGVVCNSDGHKGRPGASYPGAASFGAYGGLTCFLADDLSRDGIFDCLRRRHHYGTTGNRLHLDVRAVFQTHGCLFESDPRGVDTPARKVRQVMMGDIAQTDDTSVDLVIEAVTHTPIERIDVLNGETIIKTLRGYTARDLGHRIRVVWSGANYRGRGRKTRWQGSAKLINARILRMEKINAWNPELLFEQRGPDCVLWDTITTGNFGGFDIWVDEQDGAGLQIETNLVSADVELDRIGLEDVVFDAGGLKRCIRVFRLPEVNSTLELNAKLTMPLKETGDNPLWIRLTTEDGFNAWSSPIFIYRDDDRSSQEGKD